MLYPLCIMNYELCIMNYELKKARSTMDLALIRGWALRDSNPRPSACKASFTFYKIIIFNSLYFLKISEQTVEQINVYFHLIGRFRKRKSERPEKLVLISRALMNCALESTSVNVILTSKGVSGINVTVLVI